MMTIAPIRSAAHAANYFEQSDHADYYTLDEVCPSRWLGEASSMLGINNQVVTPERFKRYLTGNIAGERIGCERLGQWQHKPGFDLVFSPPKSVSMVSLVGGDARVISAEEKAVEKAVCWLENNAAFTRVHYRNRQGGDVYEHALTRNLLAAVFRHETSRSLDPQLHSHVVALNATRRSDGQWRSLESRHLYALQKEAGLVYRQALSASLRQLGYELEVHGSDNFEIAGVPKSAIDAFSQRRSVVNKLLEEKGYSRENAPAALKERLAHISRERKIRVDKEVLRQRWLAVAYEHSFLAPEFVQAAVARSESLSWQDNRQAEAWERLESLVRKSIRSLSERDAVFGRPALEQELNRRAVGYGLSATLVQEGIEWAVKEGWLLGGRTTKAFSKQFQRWESVEAFTTPSNIHSERRMLQALYQGMRDIEPVLRQHEVAKAISEAEHRSFQQGFDGWTDGQKTAVRGVLSSRAPVVGIQGLAGTAKTSTALKTIAQEYRNRGYHVVGMAPSVSACHSLGEGAEIDSVSTVASYLLRNSFHIREAKTGDQKEVLVVDEASLLSTKDMGKMLAVANKKNARVVLVGDIRQLGSVDAGAAFRQLQDHGLKTFRLEEIVRQEDELLLESVYSASRGDAKKALTVLSEGGGKIVEVSGSASGRHQSIVDAYLGLNKAERERTLLIDPSRKSRDQLNQCIREALQSDGEIGAEGARVVRLERVDLTQAGRRDIASYEEGDIVRFRRPYKRWGIERNSYWCIANTDALHGIAELTDGHGRRVTWNPAAWGTKVDVFRPTEAQLAIGDQIRWTMNDKSLGLNNGSRGTVRGIDAEQKTAEIVFRSGKNITINYHDHSAQHWDYDYVSTVHAAQGQTTDRVIYHAESFRYNLSSQKALYVTLSRAKHGVAIYTDSKDRLIERISQHAGEKQNAFDQRISDLDYGVE